MTRSHSEANYPCDCNLLADAAERLDVPVAFDSESNEYQLIFGPDDNPGKMILYYCPLCGGRMPGSKRARLFARMTIEEIKRLKELTTRIETLEDAIRILGEPDQDLPLGAIAVKPEADGQAPTARTYRTLRYSNLSETTIVEVLVSE